MIWLKVKVKVIDSLNLQNGPFLKSICSTIYYANWQLTLKLAWNKYKNFVWTVVLKCVLYAARDFKLVRIGDRIGQNGFSSDLDEIWRVGRDA